MQITLRIGSAEDYRLGETFIDNFSFLLPWRCEWVSMMEWRVALCVLSFIWFIETVDAIPIGTNLSRSRCDTSVPYQLPKSNQSKPMRRSGPDTYKNITFHTSIIRLSHPHKNRRGRQHDPMTSPWVPPLSPQRESSWAAAIFFHFGNKRHIPAHTRLQLLISEIVQIKAPNPTGTCSSICLNFNHLDSSASPCLLLRREPENLESRKRPTEMRNKTEI